MIAELRTFVVVARMGSFAGAARQAWLIPSVVSAQIRRVEEDLGYAFFLRAGRSVTLIRRGQVALQKAESLLAEYDGFKEVAQDLRSHGLPRIGTIVTAQTTMLAPALAHLHAELPELPFQVLLDTWLGLLNRLGAGELDIVGSSEIHDDPA